MEVSAAEVLAVLREQYPDVFKVCVLTATNNKQATRIAELESRDDDDRST